VKPDKAPVLSYTFSLEKGAFVISGACTAILKGLMFFPRSAEKSSFALAVPEDHADLYQWIRDADSALLKVVSDARIDAEVPPKLKTWDGAPGVLLINFRGDDFPVMEASGRISTFTSSVEIAHGTPVALLVRPGRQTTTSKSKEGGTSLVSWPLFIQGIRVIPNPTEDLMALKNATRPQVAFPAL